jgi:hypothetical protein
MKDGISAYLKYVAERCRDIANKSGEIRIQEALGTLSVELTEMAENMEVTFHLPKGQTPK